MPKNALNGSAAYLALLVTLLVSSRYRGLAAFTIVIAGLSFVLCTSLALNHRAMMGLSAGGLVIFILLHHVPLRLVRLPGFLAIAAISVGILAFYLNLDTLQQLETVNDSLVRFTGRSALSGREILWPILAEKIMETPILGHGPGVLPRDVFNTNLSAHNLFLQIALQSGFVGLTLLSLILWTLWSGLTHSKFAIVVFVIAVLDSSLEVFLLQNLLSAGLPVWMIFGLSFHWQSARSSANPIAPALMPAPPRRSYTFGP